MKNHKWTKKRIQGKFGNNIFLWYYITFSSVLIWNLAWEQLQTKNGSVAEMLSELLQADVWSECRKAIIRSDYQVFVCDATTSDFLFVAYGAV